MRYSAEQVGRFMRDHTFISTGLWQDKDNADVRYSMRWIGDGLRPYEHEIDLIEYHPMSKERIAQINKRIGESVACYAQVREPNTHRLAIAPLCVKITKAAAKRLVKDAAERALHVFLEDAGAEYECFVTVTSEGWMKTATAIEIGV